MYGAKLLPPPPKLVINIHVTYVDSKKVFNIFLNFRVHAVEGVVYSKLVKLYK